MLVHNLDERATQAFDLKLGSNEYSEPLFGATEQPWASQVNLKKANAGRYLAQFIAKDEEKTKDDGYKMCEPMVKEEKKKEEEVKSEIEESKE